MSHPTVPGPGRIAVIGDVGGQLAALKAELSRLGADPVTGRLPADLKVIQVGDLIHRGPDSDGVVRLVDGYLRHQPWQWVQLVGNHEAQYLGERSFEWRERISDDSADLLLDWWSSRSLRAAVALMDGDGTEWLVTHAGLTEGFWRRVLDSPRSAAQAAQALNSFRGLHERVLFSPGQMLGGGAANLSAGPVWASEAAELIPSWLEPEVDLPFSQAHGHSSVVDWRRDELVCSPEVAKVVTVDRDAAHSIATLPGGYLIGVDPGHGRRPHLPWRALVLENARIL